MLINACRKYRYLPVSLPRQDFMEKARERWAELGLPALNLSDPWHGYPLSDWTEENADEAKKAVTGRYFETGDKLVQRESICDLFIDWHRRLRRTNNFTSCPTE